MTCKAPDKHRMLSPSSNVRACGCPMFPPSDVVRSVAPVTAAPNEDRYPR